MKPSVYLETTIPSYYAARPSRDVVVAGRQAITREWWETRLPHFRIFISQLVLDEVQAGDPDAAKRRLKILQPFTSLEIREDVVALAQTLINAGPLPEKSAQDALHIALAAVHGVDFLLTWNCTHIANAEMSGRIGAICHDHDVTCPVICTPDELMGG